MGKKTGGLPPSGFGAALRRIRDEKGLTQKQLGEAAGIHPNTIAKMERGEVEPSWQVVLAISKAIGVDCVAFAEPLTLTVERVAGELTNPQPPGAPLRVVAKADGPLAVSKPAKPRKGKK